ncbi:MAG TPA: tRNA glutamyl-Q(34) synthetase GluQRS [Granulicella sp.]
MGSGYRGRLAPSPTGLLHLGHASTFRVAQLRAQAAGGMLLLRNEDLDPQRSRQDFVTAMLEDLTWLGIAWKPPMMVQSERLASYRAAFEHLLERGYVYPCTCSRRDLARMVQAPHEDMDDEPVYDGHCRPAADAPANKYAAGMNYRFRVPDGEAISFIDALQGPQSFTAGVDFGDFLVWRKDGLPSYQLACVVDDAAMGITEVVRGADLLKSTARQIVLQRALGLAPVQYAHTRLLVDEHGTRLAKRHDALAIRTLREHGLSRDEVLAMASTERPPASHIQ